MSVQMVMATIWVQMSIYQQLRHCAEPLGRTTLISDNVIPRCGFGVLLSFSLQIRLQLQYPMQQKLQARIIFSVVQCSHLTSSIQL